jgi:hypothetical protein
VIAAAVAASITAITATAMLVYWLMRKRRRRGISEALHKHDNGTTSTASPPTGAAADQPLARLMALELSSRVGNNWATRGSRKAGKSAFDVGTSGGFAASDSGGSGFESTMWPAIVTPSTGAVDWGGRIPTALRRHASLGAEAAAAHACPAAGGEEVCQPLKLSVGQWARWG